MGVAMQTLYEPEMSSDNGQKRNTKKCPFCAEMIQYEAIKCRYCHEFLDGRARTAAAAATPTSGKKLLHSTTAVVVGLLTIGPFALPLVWANPRFRPWVKAVITVVTLVATAALCIAVYKVMMSTLNQLKDLGL